MSERHAMPAAMEEIAETIGVRLALRIVQEFGGMEIKFPVRPHDGHRVIQALGKEDGYAICKYMGGSFVSVPHCRPLRNAKAAIARLEAEGLSRGEIARRLGLTQRHVRRMANAPPKSQLDLFADE